MDDVTEDQEWIDGESAQAEHEDIRPDDLRETAEFMADEYPAKQQLIWAADEIERLRGQLTEAAEDIKALLSVDWHRACNVEIERLRDTHECEFVPTLLATHPEQAADPTRTTPPDGVWVTACLYCDRAQAYASRTIAQRLRDLADEDADIESWIRTEMRNLADELGGPDDEQ